MDTNEGNGVPRHVQQPLQVLEARPDWLTGTARPGQRALFLRSCGDQWVTQRAAEGYVEKPFSWQGYSGRTVDGISSGGRDDGHLIRLSGECAARHFQVAHGLIDNISRLDLQVTLLDQNAERDWAKEVIETANRDKRCQAGMTGTTYLKSYPKGSTGYIGHRASQRYYRVYDKNAESRGCYPPGTWRWEIEWKQDRAIRVAEVLKRERYSPEAVRGILESSFFDYGVVIPAEVIELDWRDAGIKEETTDQRRLDWLRSSIRPMMDKLLSSYDRPTLLEALGLWDSEPTDGSTDLT